MWTTARSSQPLSNFIFGAWARAESTNRVRQEAAEAGTVTVRRADAPALILLGTPLLSQ